MNAPPIIVALIVLLGTVTTAYVVVEIYAVRFFLRERLYVEAAFHGFMCALCLALLALIALAPIW